MDGDGDRDGVSLARERGGNIPELPHAVVSESKLTEIVPTEYSADLVVTLGEPEAPDYGLIIEVQLGIDPLKKYSWPLYATALRARYHCPTSVLVVSPHEKVARWARRPIALGESEGSVFVPLVV